VLLCLGLRERGGPSQKKRKEKNEIFSSILGPYLGSEGETKKNLDEKSSITPSSSALTLSLLQRASLSLLGSTIDEDARARARLSIIYFLYSDRESVDSTDNLFFFPREESFESFPSKQRPSRERERERENRIYRIFFRCDTSSTVHYALNAVASRARARCRADKKKTALL